MISCKAALKRVLWKVLHKQLDFEEFEESFYIFQWTDPLKLCPSIVDITRTIQFQTCICTDKSRRHRED